MRRAGRGRPGRGRPGRGRPASSRRGFNPGGWLLARAEAPRRRVARDPVARRPVGRRARGVLAPRRAARGRFRPRLRWLGVFALIFVLWIGVTWARAGVTPHLLRFATAADGVVEDSEPVRALLARCEQVVASPASGTLYVYVAEGERVRAGEVLAEIVNTQGRQKVERQLAEVEAALRELEAKEGQRAADAAAAAAVAVAEVDRCALAWRQARDQGQVAELPGLRRALEDAMGRHARYAATVASYEERRGALQVERDGLKKTLSQPACLVESPIAGVVSFHVDGLEAGLEPGRLGNLGAGEVADLASRATAIQAAAEDEAREPAEGDVQEEAQAAAPRSVTSGEPLLKVIDTIETYFIVCLPSARAEEVAARQRAWLKRPGSSAADAVPVEVRGPGRERNGQRPLVLVAPDPFLDVAPWRCGDVELVVGRWYGVVVPQRALTVRDGRRGAFVAYKASLRFVPVEVLGAAAGQAAVEGIEPNVRVVINPYLARDGMPVP